MSQPRTESLRRGDSLVFDVGDLPLQGPTGVVWGLDSPELNANFVTVRAGGEIPQHRNGEVDVMILVVSGSGEIVIDGNSTMVASDSVALIPRGAERSIRTEVGINYFSVHARRAGLGLSNKAD